MKIFYRVFLLLFVTLLPLSAVAQLRSATNPTPSTYSDFVMGNFINYYKMGGVHEKLYMVTDKPYYSAGDTIYFSAFLVNSIYFNRTTESRYIYVELIDASGDIHTRLLVRGNEGRFHNAIPLSTRTTPGKYTLRAYTKWQTNFDKEFLFTKQLEIGNYIDDALLTKITYDFSNQGRVVASVEVTNSSFAPIANTELEYSLSINGRTTHHMTATDKHGTFRFSFKPSANNSDYFRLNISANNRQLDRKISLPSFEEDFSVKFLPEGGNLVAGIKQLVAFKAVGTNGRAVDVKGDIRNKEGKVLQTISSEHKGMGKFLFEAQAEEAYIATLTSANGVTRSFALPKAIASGCVMHIEPEKDNRIMLQVATTADYPSRQLAAIVQSRGIINYVVEDLTRPLSLPIEKLRSGIAMITIVDKITHKVVAERLFFVRGAVAKASITPSIKRFSPRERVMVDFGIKNSSGEPVKGNFVASVVDASLLKEDANSDNIFSYMLLNSDLKGHIEEPTYYFEDNDAKRNAHLDLVMLTNGWRRYNVDNILAGKRPTIKHIFEKEQLITGHIIEPGGSKTRNTSVMIFRNKKEFLGVHPLNNGNRFQIAGLDSQDTTTYILQALNKNGNSSRVRIKVNPYTYPTTPFISREVFQKEKTTSLTEEYMMRSKQQYFEDGGMPVIDIEAVEIVATNTNTYDYSTSLNDFNTVNGDMTRFSSIYDALQRFRELKIEGFNIYVNKDRIMGVDGGGDNEDSDSTIIDKEDLVPALYINGQPMDISIIDSYPIEEVISVSYLNKFESMAAGINSETGAIILHVKDINSRERLLIKSMAEVVVPGYATPFEFYAPDYSVENNKDKRDNRTTIAWVPNLQSNSLGDASISFWTADRISDYRIVIEGITADGELLRNELILEAK